jgi:hypothetical protein
MIIKSRILIDTTPSNFVHFHLRFMSSINIISSEKDV